jgi:hypothetical protein
VGGPPYQASVHAIAADAGVESLHGKKQETMRVEEIKTSKKELQKLISLRLLSEIFKKRSRKHLLAYQIKVVSLKHPKTVVQNVMTEHTAVNKSRWLQKWQKVF